MSPGTNRPTRIRILDAALRIWSEEPPSVLLGGLSVSRVARTAGVTRATFYAYWPTIDDYLVDLVDHLALARGSDSPLSAETTMRDLSTATVQVTSDLYEAAERQLRAVVGDPTFVLRLAFSSTPDHTETVERLRHRYDTIEERTAAFSAAVRENWGREVRPPLSRKDLQVVYTALFEGFALRMLVDPEHVSPELYGKVVLGMTMILTRRTDDPRTLEAVLDSANAWPAVGMRQRAKQAAAGSPDAQLSEATTSLDHASGRQVVARARRLQAAMSWHDLTLADLANVTGVSEEVLIRGFGSKSGLAMAVFMLNVRERYDALARSGDAATDVRRMIAAGAAELQRAPGLTQNVVQVLSGTTLPVLDLIDWSPIEMLRDQLALTQQQGDLRADVDPFELAMTVNRLQLLASQDPGRTGASGVDMVELLLLGAGLPARPEGVDAPPYVPSDGGPLPEPFIG